ncbi:MAG TPA: ricin-type beta-trefoil lectin domain protein, partial [Polyangiales bacterium]
WLVFVCLWCACSEPMEESVGRSSFDARVFDAQVVDASAPTPDDAAPQKPPRGALPATVYARKNLYIVAHQDDDLSLMSPDLLNRIRSGEPVRTIYLTSGDAGLDCNDYVADRELGVRLAYAQMAGVENLWDEREVEVLGKVVRLLSLRGTQVTMMFMGLHNGGYNLVLPDLESLWSGAAPLIATRRLDGRSRNDGYTREELIAVLHRLLVDWQPTHVYTLDSSRLLPMVWPFDHSDHVHSALFALAALLQYDTPHVVGMYRAYNELFEQPNVSAQDAAFKRSVFQTYLAHDPKICDTGVTTLCGAQTTCDLTAFYDGYESRQYRTLVYENVSGLLRAPLASCVVGDREHNSITVAPCDREDRTMHWKVSSNGTVLHLGSGLCMDAGEGQRGTKLALAPCVDTPRQRFLLTTQHQLRGPDSTCVQLDDGALTLQECALEPRQLDWSPGMYPNFVSGLIEDLTNWEIPDWISYYGTLSFGDVEGDGDDDVCVRRSDGVYCAFADGAGFSGFARVLEAFSDALGWYAPQLGATVQLGDIDGDGADELCGRASDGVYCSDWNELELAFDTPTLRSSDFSDAQGYGSHPSRYRSLRIVDLDRDGLGDLCARHELGIACARSSGHGFLPVGFWTQDEFTDAAGWADEAYGSTLRYGDVDGDGDPDVCGRSKDGMLCARNDGASRFIDPHLWSHTGDFGDSNGWNKQLSYFGSIRLADIDRDGNADVCGRGPAGLLCSLSTSAAFTVAISLGSADAYSDKSGWQKDRYGSTLGLLDLNLDGFPDLCGWGPGFDGKIGLNCALAD